MNARRSCLAVPGSNPKMIEKSATLGADEVFLDLEDACAPAEKEGARATVVEMLASLDFGSTRRAVRVNDVTSRWCHADLMSVVRDAGRVVDSIIVPKVEDASQVHFVDHLLTGLEETVELTNRIPLQLQIESPTGAVNLREIATACDRIDALIFGPGDYAAALGVGQTDIGTIDPRYRGHQWHWVMSELAAHARAVGVQAIDGPYADFHDETGFRESATLARLLGFDGKWCVHPSQIPLANEEFTPPADDVERARRILDAYADATRDGLGAIAIDGKLVDEATRKAAESILARAG
jgi:citrate lyase subunit beta/citryl-CoA lyase